MWCVCCWTTEWMKLTKVSSLLLFHHYKWNKWNKVSSSWGKCDKVPTLAPIRCISGAKGGKVPCFVALKLSCYVRRLAGVSFWLECYGSFRLPFQVLDKSEHGWSKLDALPVLFIGLYILFQAAMQHAYQIWWALSWKWNASTKSPAGWKLWPVNSRFGSDGCKMPFYEHRHWSGDRPGGAGSLRLIGLSVIKASEGAKEGAGSLCDTSLQQREKKKWISGSR